MHICMWSGVHTWSVNLKTTIGPFCSLSPSTNPLSVKHCVRKEQLIPFTHNPMQLHQKTDNIVCVCVCINVSDTVNKDMFGSRGMWRMVSLRRWVQGWGPGEVERGGGGVGGGVWQTLCVIINLPLAAHWCSSSLRIENLNKIFLFFSNIVISLV